MRDQEDATTYSEASDLGVTDPGGTDVGVTDPRVGDPEAGMTTAEYAVGTVAACGFAALLYGIVTSSAVHDLLLGVITKALHAA